MSEQLELKPPKVPKVWLGQVGPCDICKQTIKGDFFDARTFTSQWATMCLSCWKQNTLQKLGTGVGQHYKQRTDGMWVKVAG